MNMRKLNSKTQIDYLRAVDKLAKYLKHSPEHSTPEQLREFQIALVTQGASNITMNGTITSLQFLFSKTLYRLDVSRFHVTANLGLTDGASSAFTLHTPSYVRY